MLAARQRFAWSLPLASLVLAACSDGDPTGPDAGAHDGNHDAGVGGLGGLGGGPAALPRLAGTQNYDCSAPRGNRPGLALETVASGFNQPLFVTHPPNDSKRLLVLERGGLIRLVTKQGSGADATFGTRDKPFLDLQTRVNTSGSEQGLWGLAFHPEFAKNRKLYVFFSAQKSADTKHGDLLLEEYLASPNGDAVDVASSRRVLRIPHPRRFHNGGTLAFGADGYLYVSSGDGGPELAEEKETAQDPRTLYGKILRIDPEAQGGQEYSTPADNLIESVSDAAPEVWDRGLRNPYRMNFDACTGDLYIGDVGEQTWEEIEIEPAGSGPRNYGWPLMEGENCRPKDSGCEPSNFTLPVAVLPTLNPSSSIVGGSVYRGSDIPALRGAYFFAITQTGAVHTLRFDDEDVGAVEDLSSDINPEGDEREVITSIQAGGDGELYFTGFISGRVLRLVAE